MKTLLKTNCQPAEWLTRRIHNGLCATQSIVLMVILATMSFSSHGQTIDPEIMRELKQVARQNNFKINTKQTIVEHLNGGHYQISIPSASLRDVKKEQGDKPVNVAVIYISAPIFDKVTNKEIPKGSYLLRMVNSADGPVSQLIQNNKVIVQGDVHPPCNNGETASINGPTLSSYSSNNGSALACASRCTFFILYCQIEYSGGYCSEQLYFCGGCFGFW